MPETQDEPVVEQEVAQPEKKAKRKLNTVLPEKGFKVYTTTQKHTYPIDIQIHGEAIYGQWSREDGFVEFLVPDHLVEGFETHYHFKAGNIVAGE